MKNGFWKRMRYYLTGILLGSVMVFFMFGERACSWLPGNRVKEDLLNKVIVFPEDQVHLLNEMGVKGETIYNLIINGNVDFGESLSKPNVYPKSYIVENQVGDTMQRVQFSMYEDSYITVVHALKRNESAKIYKELSGWGEMVKFPRDSMLVFIEKSNYVQCKARGLVSDIPNDIVQDMIHSGKIDFSNSDLMLTKATQRISFVQNDTLNVTAETIWYKHRITFKDFFWDKQLPCE